MLIFDPGYSPNARTELMMHAVWPRLKVLRGQRPSGGMHLMDKAWGEAA